MKNFDGWNEIKKRLDSKNRTGVKVGEVFWCKLGLNVGVEQNGNEEEFYVRRGQHSMPLSGSSLLKYIENKFRKKD
jgi:hypothetical protein